MNLNTNVNSFADRAKQSKQDKTRELMSYYLAATTGLTLHLSVYQSIVLGLVAASTMEVFSPQNFIF